ncbi:hypothetical protein JTE90_027416 [Oedothorax gibbosus]|uniref:Uncharacterized protein n=1 Tax=Oedothorax gibbosus TaxID=931172 RepID=A0AAV6VZS6_9ARAC|nr:hypothetical protein JTE90_027416 [Oedothorax gibbosus]
MNLIGPEKLFFHHSIVSLLPSFLTAENRNLFSSLLLMSWPHEEHKLIVHITHNTPFFNGVGIFSPQSYRFFPLSRMEIDLTFAMISFPISDEGGKGII